MVDIGVVKARLQANLEAYLRGWFPNGKVIGPEFCIGDLSGQAGTSLKVSLRDGKAGVWQDFATGDTGDILDLYCRHHRISLVQGMKKLAGEIGIQVVGQSTAKKRPPKPSKDGLERIRGTAEYDWLVKRGIQEDTMRLYRLRLHRRPEGHNQYNATGICLPYEDWQANLVMLKSTGINPKVVVKPDGTRKATKDIWTTPPYYTLWGWWLVSHSCRCIIITEGEWDAMSVHQMSPGHPVLSLPAGSSNMGWIDNDWERLSAMERIILCVDMDEAGDACAKTMVQRFGPSKVFRVPVPEGHKDANDAYKAGLRDWSLWLESGYYYQPQTLNGTSGMLQSVMALANQREKYRTRNDFVFPSIDFQFRSGECTIVTGYPGGGKSAFLYQCMLHEAMANGRRVLSASFEISPAEQVLEMAHLAKQGIPAEQDIAATIELLDGKMWWWKPTEDSGLTHLLQDMLYAVRRHGVWLIVVDSLHFLVGKEDWEQQDKVSKALTEFAKSHDVCVVFVAHSKIKDGEDKIPTMSQVEGSGGITKPVDNGMSVWRNIKKEEGETGPDAILKIWKQRSTGILRQYSLWFHPESKAFRPHPNYEMKPIIGDGNEDTELF